MIVTLSVSGGWTPPKNQANKKKNPELSFQLQKIYSQTLTNLHIKNNMSNNGQKCITYRDHPLACVCLGQLFPKRIERERWRKRKRTQVKKITKDTAGQRRKTTEARDRERERKKERGIHRERRESKAKRYSHRRRHRP